MRSEIVLMGPMSSGKTTLAKKISKMTGIAHLNIDCIKWDYFSYYGYEEACAEKEYSRDGIRGLHEYYKLYEIKTLRRVFSKYKDCIFDLGAGFTVYNHSAHQSAVNSMLSIFHNKFTILPHAEYDKSRKILLKRFINKFKDDDELENILSSTPGFHLNDYFLKHYYETPDLGHIIYTANKSTKTIAKSIISHSNLCSIE